MFKIQLSKKHVTILKPMETLVDMTFSVVIITQSDYDPDSININKTSLKTSCGNY